VAIRLSFKHKVTLAGALALGGFASLGAVTFRALNELRATVGEVNALSRVTDAVLEARVEALHLADDRRSLVPNTATPFLAQLGGVAEAQGRALKSAASSVSDPVMGERLGEMRAALLDYTAALEAWVAQVRLLGLDQESGLRGALRTAGEELAQALRGVPVFESSFHQVRRGERDLLFRRDAAYLGGLETEIGHLTGAVGDLKYGLSGDARDVQARYADAFGKAGAAVLEVVGLEKALSGTLLQMKETGRQAGERVARHLGEARDRADQAAARARTTVLGVTGVVALVLGALLAWIGVGTTRSLSRTVALLKDMATGEGDLTRRLPQRFVECNAVMNCEHTACPSHGVADPCWSHVGSMQLAADGVRCHQLLSGEIAECEACPVYAATRRTEVDEFDRLAHWFNTFADRIRHLVEDVAGASSELADAVQQMSGATGRIASSNEEAAAQTQAVASAAEEMSVTVAQVARNTGAVSESADDACQAAVEGSEVIAQAVGSLDRIATVVERAAAAVRALGARSDTIGSVVQVIEDIADQTNLLALNAAIEAARAGEHGRGFAVVADEVRKLAEKTVKATREIGETIVSIQAEAQQAVGEMDTGHRAVEQGRGLGARAGEAVHAIQERVSHASTQTGQIAQATGQLADTIRELAANMEEMARGSALNTGSVADLARTAERVAGKADQLRALTGRFRT